MLLADALQQGRACFERQAWREAHDLLSDADREAPLAPEDIDRLATCAFLLGDESGSADLWARAHQEFQKRGDVEQAALCAFRIGIGLFLQGQAAHYDIEHRVRKPSGEWLWIQSRGKVQKRDAAGRATRGRPGGSVGIHQLRDGAAGGS